MKLYSDTLTTSDIYEAARAAGVELFHCLTCGSRKRKNAWEISLSGSSPYTSQSSFCEPHKAATWSEHGVWMADLYKRDPKLIVAGYKTLDDFLQKTALLASRVSFQPPKQRAYFAAPWLHDVELLSIARALSVSETS